MASLSLIPFPFALHSLSSSRLAVTHGNTNQNKTKTKGRRVSYTNSSQVHKVSPWATCSKGWVSSKTVSILFLFLLPQTRGRQHTSIGCVCPLQTSTSHHVWVRRSSKLLNWLTCVIIRRQITPDRTMKSTPGNGQVETTLTLSNCNNSVHTAVQGYFGSTKIVSSNSFSDVQSRQNRSRILFAKNWFRQIHVVTTNLLCSKLATYKQGWKVSIPASLVSNNVKLGFPCCSSSTTTSNSRDRRLFRSHGCKNHVDPESQFSKHANVPIITVP